ncbi:MAG: hypothetical protein NC124_16785 [Clostridium sp.]|nr:hypothetical protein [Bacteroidales bacterium]MCM1207262.1 hypothetical protein [Bacillota bacterium]MCM1500121.1 hypothetical protein [Clostridium sp.]
MASRNGNSWTVDVTKRGLADSISNRINRKGTWTHVKNKVLSGEVLPEITASVGAQEIAGMWSGKAYSYDWSGKTIVGERDFRLSIECSGDSVHISCYEGDSLVTAYSPRMKEGRYVSKMLTEEQKAFPWTVTSTMFARKDGHLLARMRTLNLKSLSTGKPMIAVLTRDGWSVTDASAEPSFTLNSASYSGGQLLLDITATVDMEADISLCSVYGTTIQQLGTKRIEKGSNKIAVPALLNRRDMAGIVAVSHKNERHSRTITVGGYE